MKITLFHNVAQTDDGRHAAWDRPRHMPPFQPHDEHSRYPTSTSPRETLMSTPDPCTIPANVAAEFLDAWRDQELADEVATKLNCTEVRVLAELLTALGRPQAAEMWIDSHADADDGGDAHFRPSPPAEGQEC